MDMLACSYLLLSMICVQGEMAAMFLRHEGFLGAMGAFLKVHPMEPSTEAVKEPRKVQRFYL